MSISLVKGQKVSLSKDGAKLSRVFMGLGWDVAQGGGFLTRLFGAGDDIDLDASCLIFDESNVLLEAIFYNNLRGLNGLVVHTGDNLTGAGDGDDEVIKVNLGSLPPQVKTMVFIVSSYKGQTFDKIANAYCRVVDETSGKELVKYNISETGSHTGLIMAKVYLHNAEWKMHALGEKTGGRTPADMLPAVLALLGTS